MRESQPLDYYKLEGDLREYFNKNTGIFTALAVFLALALILSNSQDMHLLSFSGFFLSFILICYLLRDIEEIRISNAWFGVLFLGYTILFFSSLSFGANEFSSYFNSRLFPIILTVIILFYGSVVIKLFWNIIKDTSHYIKMKRIESTKIEEERKESEEFDNKGFIEQWKVKKSKK